MKKCINIFYNVLFYGVLVLIILFLLIGFLSKNSGNGFSVGGYKAFDILTGSMNPTIKPGSLVIVKEINPSDIKKDDVITFRSDITGNITTHRAIEIDKVNGNLEFTTKGDANNVQDPVKLEASNVVGKVIFQIPYVGGISRTIQENKVVCIIGVLVFITLISIISKKDFKLEKA